MNAAPTLVPLAVLETAGPDETVPDTTAQEKLAALRGIVRGYGSAVVAYSGGVDSSLVMKVAHDELGARALAVTVASAFLSTKELAFARSLAATTGAAFRVIGHDVAADARLMANTDDRCYFCKFSEYGSMVEIAAAEGFAVVADGTQADDALEAHRPGLRAVAERGVRSPLREAGMTKQHVRAVSRLLGLQTFDKASAPCLASRFPYGEAITVAGLRKVEAAEDAVHALGFREVRVRIRPRPSGDLASVEVGFAELSRLSDPAVSIAVRNAVQSSGFAVVEVDPAGYHPSVPMLPSD